MLMLYREYKIGPVVEIEGSPDVGRCTLEELLSRLQFGVQCFCRGFVHSMFFFDEN